MGTDLLRGVDIGERVAKLDYATAVGVLGEEGRLRTREGGGMQPASADAKRGSVTQQGGRCK